MQKYSKILDPRTNVVAVLLSDNLDYAKKNGFILHNVEQGYDSNWYIEGYAPKDALTAAKIRKKQMVNQWREEARMNESATYAGDEFEVDEVSSNKILAKVISLSTQSEDKMTTYKSKTNVVHTFSPEQIKELNLVITNKIEEIYFHSWALKNKIDESTSLRVIDSLTWNSVV